MAIAVAQFTPPQHCWTSQQWHPASHNIDAEAVLKSCKSFSTDADVALPEVESRCLFEAKWLKHNHVGTEHLILAVCSFSDCRAARVLADIGTPSVEVCRDVLQLLGHQDRFDQWLADQPKH